MFFLLKGIPPRATFDKEMSDEENKALKLHFDYWRKLAVARINVFFSPVADASGSWGMAIVEVSSEQEAADIRDNDPIILAQIGFRVFIYPLSFPIMRNSAKHN